MANASKTDTKVSLIFFMISCSPFFDYFFAVFHIFVFDGDFF